jgi:hypothetical protein
MAFVNAKPKKSKKFEIRLPTKCRVIDKSPKFNMLVSDIDSYSEANINVSIFESERNAYVMAYTLSENNVIIDTLVTEFNLYNGFEWLTKKIKPEQSYSVYKEAYLANNGEYQKAIKESAALINKHKESYAKAVESKRIIDQRNKEMAEIKRINDSIRNEELAERRRIAEEEMEQAAASRENQERRRMLGDYEYEFTEPTSPIKTKTFTNNFGAKVSYQYYINENGYEVYHGKYTETMNFKDHKYYANGSIGFITVNGTETITYHYRNGIVHGNLSYSRNLTTTSTFNTANAKLKQSYNFNVYKGFISENFKFEYNGITYTGKATNGILDYCNYETRGGYHGKLTSNSSSKTVSIAEINNGYRTFEFDSSIDLQSVIVDFPLLRFPLIGQ